MKKPADVAVAIIQKDPIIMGQQAAYEPYEVNFSFADVGAGQVVPKKIKEDAQHTVGEAVELMVNAGERGAVTFVFG